MNAIVPVEEALEPTSEVISILEEFLTKLEAGARLNPEDLTARCPSPGRAAESLPGEPGIPAWRVRQSARSRTT